MSRDIPSVVLNALDDSVIYPFFAVELGFDSPNTLRLWTGQGELTFNSTTWYGTGELLQISKLEETAEIAAKGATLTLSGVDQSLVLKALSTPYQGRPCKIYFGVKGDTTAATEVFSGYMNQMSIEEGPETSSIQLTVESKLVDLERSRVARYTSAYQKSKFTGDKGFDFVESLQDQKLSWGKESDD